MKVKVGNRLYEMSKTEFEKLLQVASDQVPFGIYAVQKSDYAELRNDQCRSITQLKQLTRQFRLNGYRVYANGR